MWYETLITSILVFVVGQFIKQKMDNKNASSRKRKSVVSSLTAEAECLLRLIQNRLDEAKKISNDNKAFVTIPIDGDYFRVFDSVAADLSAFDSNGLATKTIQTYMEVKGLFDDVRWFSTNAFELKRGLVLVNGNITPLLQGYIGNQTAYFDAIIQERAPAVCRSLEDLIQDFTTENKK